MNDGPPIRVLHCPTTTGGHAGALARAERSVGIDSRCVTYRENYIAHPVDEVLWHEGQGPLGRQLACWRLLGRALRDYDVIHFNAGAAIFHGYAAPRDPRLATLPAPLRYLYPLYGWLTEFLDVRLLRAAGKKILVTYQGSDARLGSFCREHFEIHAPDKVHRGYHSPALERRRKVRFTKFGRLAHAVMSLNPDLMHVLPRKTIFFPYASVDLNDWKPAGPTTRIDRTPLVTHAPTHRGVKGTQFILQAVDRLRAEGVDFEFRLVEGLSRTEARRTYEETDLFIDQLLLGWYGSAAVELMSLGKPVIAYIRKEDLGFVPAEMAATLPLIEATPESIYDVLRRELTTGRAAWQGRGMAGREFVERWHDPKLLALRTRDIYEQLVRGGDAARRYEP